jgi:branched-chain amino acid transport system ATP-binding protein
MAAFADLAATKAMTILLVEQRIKAALAFAEAVIILERGRIAWSGTPAELAAQPETVDRLLGVGH